MDIFRTFHKISHFIASNNNHCLSSIINTNLHFPLNLVPACNIKGSIYCRQGGTWQGHWGITRVSSNSWECTQTQVLWRWDYYRHSGHSRWLHSFLAPCDWRGCGVEIADQWEVSKTLQMGWRLHQPPYCEKESSPKR